MSELLKIEGVYKNYQKGPETIEVLKNLNFETSQEKTIAIVGASGVGKSTLLHILGALDKPTKGKVFYRGQDLSEKSSGELAKFRNESIGFIFQFHYLLPEFTSVENVEMPLLMRGTSKNNASTLAKSLLEKVGLGHRFTHKPAELSGGEQQRVAIARALVGDPTLVLADEPTGNLDVETGRAVMELLFSVMKKEGRSLIVATHNPELAQKADQILRLKAGQFEEAGSNA